jgi:hypothetical protein
MPYIRLSCTGESAKTDVCTQLMNEIVLVSCFLWWGQGPATEGSTKSLGLARLSSSLLFSSHGTALTGHDSKAIYLKLIKEKAFKNGCL